MIKTGKLPYTELNRIAKGWWPVSNSFLSCKVKIDGEKFKETSILLTTRVTLLTLWKKVIQEKKIKLLKSILTSVYILHSHTTVIQCLMSFFVWHTLSKICNHWQKQLSRYLKNLCSRVKYKKFFLRSPVEEWWVVGKKKIDGCILVWTFVLHIFAVLSFVIQPPVIFLGFILAWSIPCLIPYCKILMQQWKKIPSPGLEAE